MSGLYLELPDAGALHGGLLHGAVHEGDEHVEQQDVGEDDVADEEQVEHLLVLVVFGELHVAHADGELEELQHGERDVPVGGLDTLFSGLVGEKKTAFPLTAGVPCGRLDQQGDHRCGQRTHTRKTDWSSAVLIYMQYLAKMKKTFDKIHALFHTCWKSQQEDNVHEEEAQDVNEDHLPKHERQKKWGAVDHDAAAAS